MEDKQQQLLANIIRDSGIVLSKDEKTHKRFAALKNMKKNTKLLEDEIIY